MKFSARNGGEARDVCLVSPPCSYIVGPSLALGLLKAELLREGISCCVDYADVRFLHSLGVKRATRFCQENMMDFLGEYIFAKTAGVETKYGMNEIDALHRGSMKLAEAVSDRNLICEAEKAAAEETEKTVRRILARDPKIVGVTSCFHQRNGALSILRRVKELRPDIVTMIGGANCFGPAGLGLLKRFDCIDYVFFGESDDIFADVCRMAIETGVPDAANGKQLPKLPYGVLRRGDALPDEAPHRIVEDLDSLPYPDYDDFFELLTTDAGQAVLSAAKYAAGSVTLYLESSRGCWWGEQHACTFCGLNGKIRKYRRKNAARVFEEIKAVCGRYGVKNIYFTDCVMPKEWMEEFIPLLEHSPEKYSIFTEVRASLSDDELRRMYSAGIRRIQPGIESLSGHELRLMRKGVSAVGNLGLLKTCRETGMKTSWNILYGFPGEVPDDYRDQTKLIPLIEHLTPPNSCSWLVYARDSEYEQNREKYGLSLVPSNIYGYMCPDDEKYIADIALYYDTASKADPEIITAAIALKSAVNEWIRRFNVTGGGIRLDMTDTGEELIFVDTRDCAQTRTQCISGVQRKVYLLCRSAVTMAYLKQALSGEFENAEIEDAVASLMEKKILLSYGDLFFSLAVEFSPERLKEREILFFRKMMRKDSEIKRNTESRIAQLQACGWSLKEAVSEAVTEYASGHEMLFTGEDYLQFADGR